MRLTISKQSLLAVAFLGGISMTGSAAFAQSAALTVAEQAAAAKMLNQVNALSGKPLQDEVQRLTKEFSDQGLNVGRVATAVKTASGNKLGAVSKAFGDACSGAPAGSAYASAACAAAAASVETASRTLPDNPTAALPGGAGAGGGVANVQTAALGGGGAGGGNGLGTLTGGGGSGTGNGNSGTTLVSGTAGQQSDSNGSVSGHSGSVGNSVSPR